MLRLSLSKVSLVRYQDLVASCHYFIDVVRVQDIQLSQMHIDWPQ